MIQKNKLTSGPLTPFYGFLPENFAISSREVRIAVKNTLYPTLQWEGCWGGWLMGGQDMGCVMSSSSE